MLTDDVLREELVDKLMVDGVLTDPAWIAAFSEVPRHAFTPTFWYRAPELRHVDLAQNPELVEIVYRDIPLVTQFNNDGTSSCSSSQPTLMAAMLEALDATDGHSVLEIGTGTGYNAALLSNRLGGERVTSIEFDPTLAAAARQALVDCGHGTATVIVGDGAQGYAARAAYDRIIATHAVRRVPTAWIEQLRPGGVIVINIGYDLVALHATDDRRAVTGRFLDIGAGFMRSRTDRALLATETARIASTDGQTTTTIRLDYNDEALQGWLRLFVPNMGRTARIGDDIAPVHYFAVDHHNWARVDDDRVTFAGTLWAKIEHAQRAWVEAGRPGRERLGLTVDIDGRHLLWVDSHDSQHRWLL